MKTLTNKKMWLFAVGQLGWSLLNAIVVNWLIFFYQPDTATMNPGHILFIPQGKILLGLTVIGLIAAFGRIFDAVTDPIIASVSDRSKNKNGRRIPFMRAIAIPFGIVTVLMFMAPVNRISNVNSLWLFVVSILFYLFMTIYCTPFNALIPELGKTQKDRINISTYISVTFFLGTTIAYLLPNIAGLFESSFGYVNSLRITISIMSVIGVICLLVPTFAIKEKDYIDTVPSDTPAFKSLIKTFRNKEFRTFVSSDVLYWIALTLFQTGLPFFVTVLMKLDTGMTFVLFAIMSAFSLVFYAPVNVISKKIGKKKMVVGAFIFFSGVFLITSTCGMFGIDGMVYGVVISILAAIPMAILGILPQAIVADISECDSIETKENREGMFYAARTFAFKLAQSFALLVFTGMARVGTDGQGYRIAAITAAVFCLIGGLTLLKYNEKKVFNTINKDE